MSAPPHPSTNSAWVISPCSPPTPAGISAGPAGRFLRRIDDLPIPTPGPTQVLLAIEAVSLNFRDLLISTHDPIYPLPAQPDLVPCSDAVGIIVSTGPHSRWASAVGTRALPHFNTWIRGTDFRASRNGFRMDTVYGGAGEHGTLQRYRLVDDDRIVPVPKGLSVAECASLMTAGLTAWNALMGGGDRQPRVEKGTRVLTQGTGGVSCAAIQIAAAAGAEVVATSSAADKLEVAKKLGAKWTVNYNETPEWAEEVKKLTGGEGVDLVVEVGGSGTIAQSIEATRYGGWLSLSGILTKSESSDLVPSLLFGVKTIRSVFGAGSREMMNDFIPFVEKHNLRPVIAKTFRFDQAIEAFQALADQTEVGKFVIMVDETAN